jgi:radical SAM superfamily enzyme YgiQ (UPF0313 family)
MNRDFALIRNQTTLNPMKIILATLNARYVHASFGLRYLLANLGALRSSANILEFDINQRPIDIAESILSHHPTIIGLGIYVWNASQSLQLAAILKRLRPDVALVLGGPEISHETDQQEITQWADFVIQGEGDLAFAQLCQQIDSGQKPSMKIIPAPLPDVAQLKLPYDLYTDQDIAHRILYVEASRGCPFRCEFCLSSLDIPLRNVPIEPFLAALDQLLERGAKQFKFDDRTFNLNPTISTAILDFFLHRLPQHPNLFLHFEMIPDRLPESLRQRLTQFPPGTLQFEVGIQTFNETVADLISRRQDNAKVEANFHFLRRQTTVHIHADLIAGLPGEDLNSFAAGFDRLVALDPHEIQLGILKRLRGAPIARHDQQWQMVYCSHPPYEILQTKLIDFQTMQKIRRFARYWDLVANSGHFVRARALIWAEGSAFWNFWAFSQWLYDKTATRTHGIALNHLSEFVTDYLLSRPDANPQTIADALSADQPDRSLSKQLPKRQARHQRAGGK